MVIHTSSNSHSHPQLHVLSSQPFNHRHPTSNPNHSTHTTDASPIEPHIIQIRSSAATAAPALSSSPPHTKSNKKNNQSSVNISSISIQMITKRSLFSTRWFTLEYLLYYLILGSAYYYGTLPVLHASNELASAYHSINDGNTNNRRWIHGLQPGWLCGRMIDTRDTQYHFFRSYLPLLSIVACIYCITSYTIKHISSSSPSARLIFNLSFSTIFILYVNGSGIVFMYLISLINYLITCIFKHTYYTPLITWFYCTIILLCNEYYRGYTFTLFLSDSSSLAVYLDSLYRGVNTGWYILYNLTCLRMISFNMDYCWSNKQPTTSSASSSAPTAVSNGMNGNTARPPSSGFQSHTSTCIHCATHGESGACLWWREKQAHSAPSYNLLAYYAYLYYVPLHFAGPITTFNSFYSHILYTQQTYSIKQIIVYTIRLLFCIFVLEVMLHYLYVFALTNSDEYKVLDVYAISMTSYWTLKSIWLKFLVIWRFFRLWALCDGIETAENMNRCMSNHFSVMEFWRAWHRSFNRWLIRYIYIPLGGNRVAQSDSHSRSDNESKTLENNKQFAGDAAKLSNSVHDTASRQIDQDADTASVTEGQQLLSSSSSNGNQEKRSSAGLQWLYGIFRRAFNIFVVFTFVAFWHDRELKLLAWGWLIALLFLPELILRALFSSNIRMIRHIRSCWYYRHLKASAAAGCIWMMMVANLVGYSVGVNGTYHVINKFFDEGGIKMCVITFAVFFSAAQLMFAVREDEEYHRSIAPLRVAQE